ncbi:MAG: hypothetical protein LBQ42_11520, partial [Synergistaceae bacterium]|nr:hypothetical protein [Synergistaceae bacterium]
MEKNRSVWGSGERKTWATDLSMRAAEKFSDGYAQAKEKDDFIRKKISDEITPMVMDGTIKEFCGASLRAAQELWGEDAANYLKEQEREVELKLRDAIEQIPPILPEDLGDLAIVPWSRACMVILGTFFGMALGSIIFGLFFGEVKIGILIGGLIFSGLTTYFLADEKKFERWLNRACVVMASWVLWDTISKNFRKIIPFTKG